MSGKQRRVVEKFKLYDTMETEGFCRRISCMRAKKFTKETILQIDVKDRGFDPFKVGDSVAVHQSIVDEGGKERVQVFEGAVIAMHNKGIASTFTVRKIGAHGIAVERIYPYFAPFIKNVKRIKQGKVRRAKLYYVRNLIGKAAKLKELVVSRVMEEVAQHTAE